MLVKNVAKSCVCNVQNVNYLDKIEEKLQNIWSVLIKFLSLHRSVLVVPEVFQTIRCFFAQNFTLPVFTTYSVQRQVAGIQKNAPRRRDEGHLNLELR